MLHDASGEGGQPSTEIGRAGGGGGGGGGRGRGRFGAWLWVSPTLRTPATQSVENLWRLYQVQYGHVH